MRSSPAPPGAEVIRTYAEYGELIDAFFRGCYQLLFIVGRPGLAKSHEFEQRLDEGGEGGHLIKGWAAPLQAYIEAYRHRNQPLIFDDAEVLWKRPGGRILIRSLTEHRPQKLIQWRSTVKELAKAGVPQSFSTTSRIAIVANRFAFGSSEEQEAVLDRGHLVYFDPLPVEVHQRVGDWFWSQEIYDYLAERLHMLDSPSVRTYLKAWERKEAGGDWRKLISEVFCHNNSALLVQALESDPECSAVEDRVRKFIDQTGLSRATYFNIKRELRTNDQLSPPERIDIPPRTLRGSPPSLEDVEEAIPEVPLEGSFDDHGDLDPADWWKRPQPPETPALKSHADVGEGDHCDWLRREMQKAVDREDYERAAELRDEIRRKEEDQHKGTE